MKTMMAVLVVALAAPPLWAGAWDGTLKLGGTILDEVGDLSTVQETYNIYDGFTVAQVHLNGAFQQGRLFSLDLRDINQHSRQGDLVFRMPGTFRLAAGYGEGRQVFDPDRGANSRRQDWRANAQYSPSKWMGLSGNFSYLTRDGNRLSYPAGTASVLGTRYDNVLIAGDVSADVHRDRRGGAVSFRMSDYKDELDAAAKRRGQVVSVRLYAPSWFYDKWTHLLRGAYGVRKLTNGDIEHTITDVQYTGIVQPVEAFLFKYNFAGDRIDDRATQLKTDRFQNDVDATWFYKYGRFSGGYGYELNDDDRSLTSYNSWRLGTAFHYERYVNAKVDYASRVKKDQEELTLLKDIESSQFRARLELKPTGAVAVGGSFAKRERDLPDLGVNVDGKSIGAFGRYTFERWGSVSADYDFSDDQYKDLAGRFRAASHIVTSRIDFERIKALHLAGGVTYMKVTRDLDIEKSMVFTEGEYTLLDGYRLEVKYNVYNYDDYLLLNRYYTANVVRINLAYDFRTK
jgi:hypothetical protein